MRVLALVLLFADIESLLERADALASLSARRESLAIPFYREAVHLAHARNAYELEARALAGLGGALRSTHQYDEARRVFEVQLLPLARRHGVREAEFAALRHLAGISAETGQFEEGLRWCDAMLRRAREWNDAPKVAAALNSIAATRRRQGELGLALAAIEEAMRILDAHPEMQRTPLAFSIPFLHGGVLMDSGDFPRAFDSFERARKAAEETQSLAGIWHCLTDTALWYRLQGDLQRAARLYERALPLSRRADSRDMEALTLRGLADTHRAAGQLTRAAGEYAAALAIYRRFHIEEDLAPALVGLGATKIDAGELAAARRELDEAVVVAERIGQPIAVAMARLELGRLALRQGDSARATTEYTAARDLSDRLGVRALAPSAYAGLAMAARASGDLPHALAMFAKSDAAIARLRAAIPSAEQRSAFAAATHETYAGWVGTLLDAGRPEEALLVVERERTREPAGDRPRDDGEREIARIQIRLSTPLLRDAERADLLARLDDLEHRVGAGERAAEPARPKSLAELRHALHRDETYVVFFGTNAFVLTPGTLRVVRLAPGGQFENRVAFFAGVLRSDPAAARASGSRIAAEVVLPWLRHVPGDVARLLVSRAGVLARIPLAALPDADGRPLATRFEIDDVPSLSALAASRRHAPTRDRVLAIGSGEARRVAIGGSSYALPRLPFVSAELDALADAAERVDVLTGGEAREQALRTAGSTSVVHLAAHAFLDPRVASRSAIVLTPSGADDGLLQTREVRQLRLDTALVVLSSCHTAAGPVSPAESMHSLARAFLAAGSRSVVATFWDVDDASASRFVARFYDHLAKGKSAGRALQAAQVETMARDPYANADVWAAFTLAGDGAVRPLSARPSRAPLIALAGLIGCAVAVLLLVRRR